ncbi:hypothetical protein LJK88_10130 [Paenibacillus sp. P26]|nr:hypothetical protein LJK88_10130 [Paenibacillus sp. P26]UUZ89801.1 hypothetical protein LJK87_27535 [Paenibacillus sp. P25]
MFRDDFMLFHLGRHVVYSVPYGVLMDNLGVFPKDLYIFDETLSWSLIQTHEPQNEPGDRWLIIDPLEHIYNPGCA